jgi:S1-C subfamily serine protease
MKSRKEVDALALALGGMPVWGVLKDSVAARAGIRYGDIVLEVNGMKTPDASAFVSARGLREDGATISYHRDGSTHVAELTFDSDAPNTIQAVIDEVISQRIPPVLESSPASKPN